MLLANRIGGDAATSGRQLPDLFRAIGRIPSPQPDPPGDDPLQRIARTYERFQEKCGAPHFSWRPSVTQLDSKAPVTEPPTGSMSAKPRATASSMSTTAPP